jgi:hypothetical protein
MDNVQNSIMVQCMYFTVTEIACTKMLHSSTMGMRVFCHADHYVIIRHLPDSIFNTLILQTYYGIEITSTKNFTVVSNN